MLDREAYKYFISGSCELSSAEIIVSLLILFTTVVKQFLIPCCSQNNAVRHSALIAWNVL